MIFKLHERRGKAINFTLNLSSNQDFEYICCNNNKNLTEFCQCEQSV